MADKKKASAPRATSGESLAEAIRSRDYQKLHQVLSSGVRADSTCQDKKLDKVAHQGKPGFWPVLFIAAFNGDLVSMSTLIEAGGDPNVCTLDGWTAAHLAVASSNTAGVLSCLNALLDRGCKQWSAVAAGKHTPLSIALQDAHKSSSTKQVVSFLANQRHHYINMDRTAAAALAAEALVKKDLDMEIVAALLGSPAFVPGSTLYAALVGVGISNDGITDENVARLVDAMLQNGMAVNEPLTASDPFTPGCIALSQATAMERMLGAKLLVNRRVQGLGCGLLHEAVRGFYNHLRSPQKRKAVLRSMQLLLDHGADANLLDDKGSPALHYAAQLCEDDSRPALLLLPHTTNHPLSAVPPRMFLDCIQMPAGDLVARVVELSDKIVQIDRSVVGPVMLQHLAAQIAPHYLGRVLEGKPFEIPGKETPHPQEFYEKLARQRNELMTELLQRMCVLQNRTLTAEQVLGLAPVGRIPEASTDLIETILHTSCQWQTKELQKKPPGDAPLSGRVLSKNFMDVPVSAKAIKKFLAHIKQHPDNVGMQPLIYLMAKPLEAVLADPVALECVPKGVKALAGILEARKALGLPIADWKPAERLASSSTCMLSKICVFKRTNVDPKDPIFNPFFQDQHELDLVAIMQHGFLEHFAEGLADMCNTPTTTMQVLANISETPGCFAVMAEYVNQMCAALQRSVKEDDYKLIINVHSICRIAATWGREMGINEDVMGFIAEKAREDGQSQQQLLAALSNELRLMWKKCIPKLQASELWPALQRLAATVTPGTQVRTITRAGRLPQQVQLALNELPVMLSEVFSRAPDFKLPVTSAPNRRNDVNRTANLNDSLNRDLRKAHATADLRQLNKDHKACSCCGITKVQLLADGRKLSVCGGCSLEAYCGRDCQKQHWKSGHKEVCGKT